MMGKFLPYKINHLALNTTLDKGTGYVKTYDNLQLMSTKKTTRKVYAAKKE